MNSDELPKLIAEHPETKIVEAIRAYHQWLSTVPYWLCVACDGAKVTLQDCPTCGRTMPTSRTRLAQWGIRIDGSVKWLEATDV